MTNTEREPSPTWETSGNTAKISDWRHQPDCGGACDGCDAALCSFVLTQTHVALEGVSLSAVNSVCSGRRSCHSSMLSPRRLTETRAQLCLQLLISQQLFFTPTTINLHSCRNSTKCFSSASMRTAHAEAAGLIFSHVYAVKLTAAETWAQAVHLRGIHLWTYNLN